MKTLLALIFAVLPAACLADGYGGAEGLNRAGEILHIEDRTLYVQKDASDTAWTEASREHYDMDGQCPEFDAWHNAKGATFTCPANRDFPLSGATYKVATSRKWRSCSGAPYFDQSGDTVYVCVRGCAGRRVPEVFHVFPWEC